MICQICGEQKGEIIIHLSGEKLVICQECFEVLQDIQNNGGFEDDL